MAATTTNTGQKLQLVYKTINEKPDGLIESGETMVLGNEGEDQNGDYTLFDSDDEAISCFIDNLCDPGALAPEPAAHIQAEIVDGFRGWGTVVRVTWCDGDGTTRESFYSAVTQVYVPDDTD